MSGTRRTNTLRAGRVMAIGDADVPEPQLAVLARDPERLLRRGLDNPVKISFESVVVQTEIGLTTGPIRTALKRFRPRNAWKAFCDLWRPSRAMRMWRIARLLLDHRVPTPRPLAAVSPRLPRRSGPNYLVTEWIDAAENLHLYGWRIVRLPASRRLRLAGRCATSLGSLIGRMHAAGIAHRDLKAANLLVRPCGDGVETYLVDLDGIQAKGRLSRARRAADLARLAAGLAAHPWVSRSVCRRFLRAYAAEFPPGAIDWKSLWRAVARRARRIVARKRAAR